jgi:hypothetical protein
MPIAPLRDEHDDTTSVFERSEVEAFAQRRDAEARVALATPFPPPDADAITVPPISLSEAVTAPPPRAPSDNEREPALAAAEKPSAPTATPSNTAPGLVPPMAPGAAPSAPVPPKVVPVQTPAALASTVALPPRPQALGLGGTIVLPSPGPPRASAPKAVPGVPPPAPSSRREPAPKVSETAPTPAAVVAEPTAIPLADAADMHVPEEAVAPLPMAEAEAPAPFMPQQMPSTLRTFTGFPAQTPHHRQSPFRERKAAPTATCRRHRANHPRRRARRRSSWW